MPQTLHPAAEHAAWKQRRLVRIDRLSLFLRHCARNADQPGDWYSTHVIWAINRLDQLGYEWPELDQGLDRFRLIQGEVIAA